MNPINYPWWLASRAAGITAYLLLSLSVCGGLVMALKLAPPRLRAVVRVAHERIALLALGFIAVHGLLLLGDTWLKASLADIVIPFHSQYRPLWTGLGILAFYSAAGLSLTYYLRRRLGARRWRKAHRFIPVAWALAAVHVAGAGTDAVSLWLQVPLALSAALVMALLAERWLGKRRTARPAAGRRAAPERGPAPRVEPAPSPEPGRGPAAAPPAVPLWSRAGSPTADRVGSPRG